MEGKEFQTLEPHMFGSLNLPCIALFVRVYSDSIRIYSNRGLDC